MGADRTISIHAPRTGSDRRVLPCVPAVRHFNPRSPHGERQRTRTRRSSSWTFQSTLPARGATQRRALLKYEQAFQSTLPARGATVSSAAGTGKGNTFQSTLPARGATDSHHEALFPAGISIHAPRTGSDLHSTRTPPRRDISIHAPRTGSDRTPPRRDERGGDFNPRSPHGERRADRGDNERLWDFNPRSPHGERRLFISASLLLDNFNPRSPHGERRPPRPALAIPTKFQSTLPARGATG